MALEPPPDGSPSLGSRALPTTMAVVDAHVRVRHPCPYCDLSSEFPGSTLLLWCDNRRDTLLVCSPDEEELGRVRGAFRRRFHGRVLLADGPAALLAVPDFEWESPPSVTGLARRGGVWVLPPVLYAEGTETYRMIAPDRPRLHRLFERLRRLGEVTILSVSDRNGLEGIRDYPTASVHFFEGLTAPQLRSLLAAHEAGLLEIPARSSWSAAARSQGVGRSTFGEHLRKAQLRLLRNSYPILRARALETGRPVVLPALAPGEAAPRPPSAGSVRGRRAAPRAGSARRT
ncbi:MAG TPA: helix-turn-helix domain-containing protein [Thermoplasmata archaeon]|nr:helix-turn-helix domain-containing protein [Thermoplasmata archaeon]